jgi:hypothetical protein
MASSQLKLINDALWEVAEYVLNITGNLPNNKETCFEIIVFKAKGLMDHISRDGKEVYSYSHRAVRIAKTPTRFEALCGRVTLRPCGKACHANPMSYDEFKVRGRNLQELRERFESKKRMATFQRQNVTCMEMLNAVLSPTQRPRICVSVRKKDRADRIYLSAQDAGPEHLVSASASAPFEYYKLM